MSRCSAGGSRRAVTVMSGTIAWFDRYSTIRLAWAEGDGIDFRLECL